jgi:hypothetical protein
MNTAQDYGIVHWAISRVKLLCSPLPCPSASGLSSTPLNHALPHCAHRS